MIAEETETDQEPGAAHPRVALGFVGHDDAEAALATSFASGRMHHAWLLTGPKGVGKATLAYRFARRALGARAVGPRPLDASADDPIVRRIAAGAHPDLFVLRRGRNDRGRPRSEITIDEARRLGDFFALKPAEGGMRVAIIDSVDDLNRNAANAILKTLEEPPSRSVLLLVCHAPGAALATIRSRCRRLTLRPLPNEAVAAAMALVGGASAAVAALARGSPGAAIALAAGGGESLAENIAAAMRAAEKKGAGAFLPLLFSEDAARADRRPVAFALLRAWARDKANDEAVDTPRRVRWAEAYSDLLRIEQEADGLDLDGANAFVRAASIIEKAAA